MIAVQDDPRPDPEAIDTFCDVVFGYVEGFAPVRTLSEKGTPDQKPGSHFEKLTELPQALKRLAAPSAASSRGLFVVPCTVRRPGSAKATDIVETAVVLVDLDSGSISAQRDHLVRHLGAPTMEVASGGRTDAGEDKIHLYWRLTEAARGSDLLRVKEARLAIAQKVGGDTSLGSLHQPIRVPGSIHGKNSRRSPVRLLGRSTAEYDLDEFCNLVAAMPAMPGLAPVLTARPRGPSASQLQSMKVREGGMDGVTRHDAITSTCGHWIRNARLGHCSREQAWAAVVEYNTAMVVPPIDEWRLRRDFDKLAQLDAAKAGMQGSSSSPVNTQGLAPQPQSEDALAAEFVRLHGQDWRHVPAWGAWYRWSGTHWHADETGRVRDVVRHICRAASAQVESAATARRLASDRTIMAVSRIAAADPQIAVGPGAWDSHPMLLNTPAGIVDLTTGRLQAHQRGHLITQITTASPGTDCPHWLVFLREVLGGDAELEAYLKRFCGYCLSGSTDAQMFLFLHGQGANGKSVFLRIISTILGSYAATATLETFMASKSDRHLTELAGLRGARLVLVPETEAGRAWAEGRIKSITGGESIRANFMRQNHFEFVPQFKLVVAGNHRPELRRTGEAMRRRLHLVPFSVTIPPDRRDAHLAEKLLAEADGILGWMIEGCLEWQREGLDPPASITAAVNEYLEDEDVLGQWIADQCSVDGRARATASDLYHSWSQWAAAGGYEVGSRKILGAQLRERGFTPGRVGVGRGWHGIEVRRTAAEGEA